jgi:hypothetical protein
LVLALVAFTIGCDDTISSAYGTYGGAKRAGAFARGWLPQSMPETATNIRETHDLDTNMTWIRFELNEAERETLEHRLESLPAFQAGDTRIPAPDGHGWWPPRLTGAVEEIARRERSCRLFQPERRAVLILCQAEKEVFFWRDTQ